MKWRNPYDEVENKFYDDLTSIHFTGDPGMTLQAPAEEQDLNVIMKRFGIKDGSRLPYWQDPAAIYGDFTDMPEDPVQAAEMLRQGEIAFMQLPAEVRRNFESGAHLYNWLQDPQNDKEAVRLGLFEDPSRPKPASIDTLAAAMQQVSINTSRDKEPLVNPPKPPKEEN